MELLIPLIYSISKSKTLKISCHRANICFEAIFSTSFFRTYFADLQSILNKIFFDLVGQTETL
jgi:hypothetical protein